MRKPPSELDNIAVITMARLRKRGHDVMWIGFQKYMVDGQRVTLLELLEMARDKTDANNSDR
jgi:hypothetical protein